MPKVVLRFVRFRKTSRICHQLAGDADSVRHSGREPDCPDLDGVSFQGAGKARFCHRGNFADDCDGFADCLRISVFSGTAAAFCGMAAARSCGSDALSKRAYRMDKSDGRLCSAGFLFWRRRTRVDKCRTRRYNESIQNCCGRKRDELGFIGVVSWI